MLKTDYFQVDENSTITCQELENLAQRIDNFVRGANPTEFIEALHSLRMNLLNVSKMIKQRKPWK